MVENEHRVKVSQIIFGLSLEIKEVCVLILSYT